MGRHTTLGARSYMGLTWDHGATPGARSYMGLIWDYGATPGARSHICPIRDYDATLGLSHIFNIVIIASNLVTITTWSTIDVLPKLFIRLEPDGGC